MKTMAARFAPLAGRFKLRDKILISFVLIVLIPSVCIGFFSYLKSSAIIEQQTSQAYLEALRQTAINISYRLTEAENISEIIYTNDTLQKVLRRASEGNLSAAEVLDDYKSITDIVSNLQKSRNIFRIRLLVPNDPLYAVENANIFALSAAESAHLSEQLQPEPGLMQWSYNPAQNYLGIGPKRVVSLYRLMKDFNNVNTNLGVVAIDLEEDTIRSVLQDMNLALPYEAMVFNGDEAVSSYAHNPDQVRIDSALLQAELHNTRADGQPYRIVRGQGSTYLIGRIDHDGWKLAIVMPSVSLGGTSKLLAAFITLLSAAFIAGAIALSIVLSRMITRRLSILADKMKGIEQGNFGELVEVSGSDEISLLQRRFNRMSSEIKDLIDEVYQITINKQREELKVLEGRINSHFLYNSLDTVKWLAIKANESDIAQLVTNLSKFFRISLNRGQDTISVEKELEHVKAYIDIQNIRFGGSIVYETEIDPSLLPVFMVKLILQPIVENAVIHGINKAGRKAGTIRIRGRQSGTGVEFLIADDGVGMDAQQLADLFEPGSGYGLQNVHRRLQLYYGKEAGVQIRSKLGRGTAVRLKLQTHVLEAISRA